MLINHRSATFKSIINIKEKKGKEKNKCSFEELLKALLSEALKSVSHAFVTGTVYIHGKYYNSKAFPFIFMEYYKC